MPGIQALTESVSDGFQLTVKANAYKKAQKFQEMRNGHAGRKEYWARRQLSKST